MSAELLPLPDRWNQKSDEERLRIVIQHAKEVVVAQTAYVRATELLRQALEEYTGQHWTRWGV